MAESHRFRTALNGFRREDVVDYIEYLNKKNAAAVNQLMTENQALRAELSAMEPKADPRQEELEKLLADALEQVAQLQAQVEKLREAGAQRTETIADRELEAYRRAERMERAAREHSEEIYRQATAALGEATTLMDEAAAQFTQAANGVSQQLQQLQSGVESGKATLQNAMAAMYAIRPQEP